MPGEAKCALCDEQATYKVTTADLEGVVIDSGSFCRHCVSAAMWYLLPKKGPQE